MLAQLIHTNGKFGPLTETFLTPLQNWALLMVITRCFELQWPKLGGNFKKMTCCFDISDHQKLNWPSLRTCPDLPP